MTKPEAAPKSNEDYQNYLENNAQINIDMGNIAVLSAAEPLANVLAKVNEILNKYK